MKKETFLELQRKETSRTLARVSRSWGGWNEAFLLYTVMGSAVVWKRDGLDVSGKTRSLTEFWRQGGRVGGV